MKALVIKCKKYFSSTCPDIDGYIFSTCSFVFLMIQYITCGCQLHVPDVQGSNPQPWVRLPRLRLIEVFASPSQQIPYIGHNRNLTPPYHCDITTTFCWIDIAVTKFQIAPEINGKSLLLGRVGNSAKIDYHYRHICVRPSVCLPAWNNLVPTGGIFMTFDIRQFFKNQSGKLNFH